MFTCIEVQLLYEPSCCMSHLLVNWLVERLVGWHVYLLFSLFVEVTLPLLLAEHIFSLFKETDGNKLFWKYGVNKTHSQGKIFLVQDV